MASSKKKNVIPRSPWRIITLSVFAVLLILAMLLSYIYVTGGDRPSDEVDTSEVNDAVWGKTLDYAFSSENVSTVSAVDTLINLTNGRLRTEIDRSSPYMSKVYGQESGRMLFNSLPVMKMSADGREYSLNGCEWSVPLNGPYNAEVSFDSALSAVGTEDDFVSIKKYAFSSADDITNWSMILKGCNLSLYENTAKVTVSSTDKPYFGSGKLDIDLSSVPDNADGCIRLRVRGKGLRSVEVNYSSVYETVRLQGIASLDVNLSDGWQYIVIPVTDGNFVGELYTVYFRLAVEEGAEFYIDSVEVGYIAPHLSSVSVQGTCTVYSGRYIVSSSLVADNGFNADSVWAESVIPADELLHIELVSGDSSEYSGVENISFDRPDYTVFHFVSGEAVAFIPTSASSIERVDISVTDGKVYFRTYVDGNVLSQDGGKLDFSYKIIYAGAEVVQKFSSSYNEEYRLLTESDMTLTAGSFDGYDPYLGRYTFTCDGNGDLDITLRSKDDRYVYFGIRGSVGDVEIFNSSGEKLPITLLSGDECIFGIYLESGEDTSFSLRSSANILPRESLLDGIGYRTSSGKDVKVIFTSAEYVCCNGFYNEIRYSGVTQDGAAEVYLTVASFADGEVSVSAYDIDISFVRDADLISLSDNLHLLSFDTEGLSDVYYSDVSGDIVRKNADDVSYGTVFSLSNLGPTVASGAADGSLTAATVHSFSATANLVPLSSVLHVGKDGDAIFVSATGDLMQDDTASFGLGDHIRLEAAFAETSVTDGGEELLSSFREAYGNGYVAAVERGTLRSVSPVPTIGVSSSYTAIFSVRGGMETLPVKVEGFNSYTLPTVKVNGEDYVPSEYGAYIDGNGAVGFVFSVPANTSVMVSASFAD